MSPRTPLWLRGVVLAYLGLLVVLPLGLVAWRAFGHGPGALWQAATRSEALHALGLTLLAAAIAVPLNTAFGVTAALLLARGRFAGKGLLGLVTDLPFAVSPVVVGLALVLVYGHDGWLGGWLSRHGVEVIFSLPGIVLATVFASLPFVVRVVVPLLEELGGEQEEAAVTLGASAWQAFWRVTLPSVRGAIGYGVVLTTARAVGEFGAVSVVSGHLAGQTQTLTLYVEDRFTDFDPIGAYTAAVVLALLAVTMLLLMGLARRRGKEA